MGFLSKRRLFNHGLVNSSSKFKQFIMGQSKNSSGVVACTVGAVAIGAAAVGAYCVARPEEAKKVAQDASEFITNVKDMLMKAVYATGEAAQTAAQNTKAFACDAMQRVSGGSKATAEPAEAGSTAEAVMPNADELLN